MMNEQIKVPAKLLPVFQLHQNTLTVLFVIAGHTVAVVRVNRGDVYKMSFMGMWLGRSGYAGVILCTPIYELANSSLEDLKHAIRESKVLSAY